VKYFYRQDLVAVGGSLFLPEKDEGLDDILAAPSVIERD
jgi:hypothetical protein